MKIFYKGLNSFHLKIIAITAMTINHIFLLVPSLFDLGGLIGKLTFPIMCFLLIEGASKTRNIKKYLFRLFSFALISQFAFTFYLSYFYVSNFAPFEFVIKYSDISHPESWPEWYTLIRKYLLGKYNVIFTLFFGLLAVVSIRYFSKKIKNEALRIILQCLTFLILWTVSMQCDWGIVGVPIITALSYLPKNRAKFLSAITFFAVTMIIYSFYGIFEDIFTIDADTGLRTPFFNSLIINAKYYFKVFWTVLFAAPAIFLYNGKLGVKAKYLFYIFYPVHFILIGIIFIMLTPSLNV